MCANNGVAAGACLIPVPLCPGTGEGRATGKGCGVNGGRVGIRVLCPLLCSSGTRRRRVSVSARRGVGAEDATEHQCRVLPVVAGAVLMALGLLPRLEAAKAVLCSTCLLLWQSKVMYLRLQRAQWGETSLCHGITGAVPGCVCPAQGEQPEQRQSCLPTAAKGW